MTIPPQLPKKKNRTIIIVVIAIAAPILMCCVSGTILGIIGAIIDAGKKQNIHSDSTPANANQRPASIVPKVSVSVDDLRKLSFGELGERFGESNNYSINPSKSNQFIRIWKIDNDKYYLVLVIKNLNGGADIVEPMTKLMTNDEAMNTVKKVREANSN